MMYTPEADLVETKKKKKKKKEKRDEKDCLCKGKKPKIIQFEFI